MSTVDLHKGAVVDVSFDTVLGGGYRATVVRILSASAVSVMPLDKARLGPWRVASKRVRLVSAVELLGALIDS